MTTDAPRRNRPAPTVPPQARRAGYLAAAAIDVVLIVVVADLVEWDVVPFLTPEFDEVVPIVSASLWAGVVCNLVYLAFDPRWIRSLGQLVSNAVAAGAGFAVYAVFPFEFTTASFESVTRTVMLFVIAASVLGVVVEGVKLLRMVATGDWAER